MAFKLYVHSADSRYQHTAVVELADESTVRKLLVSFVGSFNAELNNPNKNIDTNDVFIVSRQAWTAVLHVQNIFHFPQCRFAADARR